MTVVTVDLDEMRGLRLAGFGRTWLMIERTRTWRVLTGGLAASVAGVVGLTGATASADPGLPLPLPAPATVTQTVTVAPPAPQAGALAADPAASGASAVSGAVAQPSTAPLNQLSAAPAAVPASSGTLAEYFAGKAVAVQPQKPQGFTALKVVLPMPTGWTQVADPNVPNAFLVIADHGVGDGLYTSNAQVTVSKLVGNFDPREAITHGYVDSQQLAGWQSTNASLADFSGFPSSIIEGTYRLNDMTLNTSRRHIIATSGPDKYLVTLAVTTSVGVAVAAAPATDVVVNGFAVTASP